MEFSFVLSDEHLIALGVIVGLPLYLVIGSVMSALMGWLMARERAIRDAEDDIATGVMVLCWPLIPVVGLGLGILWLIVKAPIQLSYWLYNPFIVNDRAKT